VVVAEGRSGRGCGEDGDALVTTGAMALAVTTADCAPIALGSPEGVIGAVHAGWRGLAAGVVDAAVSAMRAMGASRVEAALGPCIHAECYEFGLADLDAVCHRLGSGVRATTSAGRPAFDLPAAVHAAVDQAHSTLVHDAEVCTACSAEQYFSHRARGERQRQAMVVWKA